MKNKFGFLGLISLLSITVFWTGEWLMLSWLGFATFFRYFWVEPDELFIETLKKCASMAFFVQLAISVLLSLIGSLIPNILGNHEHFLSLGITFGFTAGIGVFVFLTTIVEWVQLKRGASDD